MKTFRLTITLRDGEAHTFAYRGRRRPRFIGSWLMQQMPYGTDFQGATFACELAS